MAMTPQERIELETLKRAVTQLQRVEDVAFIQNIKRRVLGTAIADALALLDLEDLRNVTISSPTNGQVLKYNGSAWVNGADNT
jgi:hypothetical protein